ncbi:MAG: glycoside hydrolase family 97 N-terminal domain-containing protein [Bacteroidales bacterium]
MLSTCSRQPVYTVTCRDTTVITEVILGLSGAMPVFQRVSRLDSVTGPDEIRDNYTLLHGKKSASYGALRYTVHLTASSGEAMDIIFQVSDDGFAFCYRFPGTSEELKYITAEKSSFSFAVGTLAWIQPRAAHQSQDGTRPIRHMRKTT